MAMIIIRSINHQSLQRSRLVLCNLVQHCLSYHWPTWCDSFLDPYHLLYRFYSITIHSCRSIEFQLSSNKTELLLQRHAYYLYMGLTCTDIKISMYIVECYECCVMIEWVLCRNSGLRRRYKLVTSSMNETDFFLVSQYGDGKNCRKEGLGGDDDDGNDDCMRQPLTNTESWNSPVYIYKYIYHVKCNSDDDVQVYRID